ncbi:MAG: metalloregulator ArsR/SmtB family transcription factor [Victivallaceae bacterium]|nr:metalloregulator ArsR/SmtB family transcription factor [Victivallaceae bacterium]
MSRKTADLISAKAKILKALGHPSRLFIVEKLAQGEQCVCTLVELLGVDFSTVSKHLSILRNSGIIEYEKRGKMFFYRLKVPCLLKFIDCIEAIALPLSKE